MHILCTICSDLVNQAENIYVTKCGHIFHHHCLAQWIERSKSCPQCRNKVTERCMFRLYPTVSNEATGDDAATLQSRLDDTQLQLRQQKALSKELDDKLDVLRHDLIKNEDIIKAYEKKLLSRDSAIAALKSQLEYLKVQNKEVTSLKEENVNLKINLQTLNGMQKVLHGTADDVEKMLHSYNDPKTIATFATALKRALCDSELKKNESRDRLHALQQRFAQEQKNASTFQAKVVYLEDRLATVQRKYEALNNKRKASEIGDKSASEHAERVKLPRKSQSFDLNTAILGESNSSLSSMVQRIESAESPYLRLKQSSLALAALQRGPQDHHSPTKPSEFAIVNEARKAKKALENVPLSIFHKKVPLRVDPVPELDTAQLDISYDGLGGHSKLDTFPVPKQKTTFKSLVPKLSAKHKLKKPLAPSGSPDIRKLLQKSGDV